MRNEEYVRPIIISLVLLIFALVILPCIVRIKMSVSNASMQPARKLLIRHARLFPLRTNIWIQGIIVWHQSHLLAVDDGSGIALINTQQYVKQDAAANVDALKAGMYVMVAARTFKKFRRNRLGVVATTIRDLSVNAVTEECLWNLEVVDAFLLEKEKETVGAPHMKR